ncbi:hypothetical protein FXF51_33440 [Nonomuraea sp. PA05]|uniref:hypothetical protein n=1 Tax=Nonomuraea sp. PA05 TaxID=2604466 RepID=UPI0011D7C08C|nr:hypothetical protein [Nonomuraea sp. PA05]TYB59908.1 hypothetical protein FXF51_33440 [Nonomuraea sp. PA05]
MKKALAVAVAAASLISAVPAQAAAPDPVRAVKRQFVAGHGVKFSETVISESEGKKEVYMRVTGTYGFGPSGVVAADLTLRMLASKKPSTVRLLAVGRRVYMQTDDLRKDAPEGVKWIRMEDVEGRLRAPSNQPVDIFQLPQLKGLLSHATSVRGGVYRGTLTGKQGNQIKASSSTSGFDYRLSTGSTGLPTRLRIAVKDPIFTYLTHVDTRYSAWGHAVTIVEPAEDEVAELDDLSPELADDLPDFQELPDGAVGSLAS